MLLRRKSQCGDESWTAREGQREAHTHFEHALDVRAQSDGFCSQGAAGSWSISLPDGDMDVDTV